MYHKYNKQRGYSYTSLYVGGSSLIHFLECLYSVCFYILNRTDEATWGNGETSSKNNNTSPVATLGYNINWKNECPQTSLSGHPAWAVYLRCLCHCVRKSTLCIKTTQPGVHCPWRPADCSVRGCRWVWCHSCWWSAAAFRRGRLDPATPRWTAAGAPLRWLHVPQSPEGTGQSGRPPCGQRGTELSLGGVDLHFKCTIIMYWTHSPHVAARHFIALTYTPAVQPLHTER